MPKTELHYAVAQAPRGTGPIARSVEVADLLKHAIDADEVNGIIGPEELVVVVRALARRCVDLELRLQAIEQAQHD